MRNPAPANGYETTFRADYQCMKCGHKVFGKHPVMLSRCANCGKNSWRRYVRPEPETPATKSRRSASRTRSTQTASR